MTGVACGVTPTEALTQSRRGRAFDETLAPNGAGSFLNTRGTSNLPKFIKLGMCELSFILNQLKVEALGQSVA